jgi:SnoaL-like domain
MHSTSCPTSHRFAINDLLTRFFQAFDDKNWSMVRECLCDEVFVDYSSFRDLPPMTVSRDNYVEQRRTSLESLDMQHNFLNLRVEVEPSAERAAARCNYVIHRFQPSFDGINDHYFHSFGHYVLAFANVSGTWRISRIAQNLLRTQGNGDIHGTLPVVRTQAAINQRAR